MSEQVGVEQTPDIEAVLAAHHYIVASAGNRLVLACSCGDPLLPITSSAVATTADHEAHIAQALAPVLAAAVREARAAALDDVLRRADEGIEFGPRSWLLLHRIIRDVRADLIAVDAPEGGEGR